MRYGFVRRLFATAIVFASVIDTAGALAADAESDALEEVIVTARHKEETLQSIPLAVTAFTSEDIARSGIVDMRDIATLTPGFSFQTTNGGGNTNPVIRGAAQVVETLEQNVSFFLDGIYLPRDYVTNLGFDLLDRVEVVEGPQSARYGRNAFMGAVNYVSRTPSEDFKAEATGTIENHSSYIGTAFASGAVIPDTLRLFGGVDYKTIGGTWPNLAPFCNIQFSTGTGCELGGYEHVTYNLQAQLLINDRLTTDISYYHFHFNDQALPQNFFSELGGDSGELNCGQYNANVRPAGSNQLGAGGQWYRLYCGSIPVKNVPQDPRGYAQQLETEFYKSSTTWKVTDDFTVSNLAGYISAGNTSLDYKDVPGCTFFLTGLCIFEEGPLGHTRQSSDELRISFDNHGPLTATIGGNYSYLVDFATNNFAALPPLTAVPTAPINIYDAASFAILAVEAVTITKDEIWSPFAEVNYTFFDSRAHFGVEARYQSEKKTNIAEPTVATSGLENVSGQRFSGTFSAFTPRFTADYHLTKDDMLYVSAAKGEHAGGFNVTSVSPANDTYGPDENWTYEFGTKNTLLDGRVVVNADVYYINWTNDQIESQDPASTAALPLLIIRNLGTVYSRGFEMTAAVKPIQQLTLKGNLALNDAQFANGTRDLSWDRGTGPGAAPVCDNVVCYENGYIGGKQTPYSSKVQANLGAEWRAFLPFASATQYYFRANGAYQSKQYNEDINLSWIPGRTIVNAFVGLEGKKWELQLWSRNLFNKEYVASTIVYEPNMQYDAYLGDRQTIGVTGKYKF
jgi:iron complex outermembrane receptor protein